MKSNRKYLIPILGITATTTIAAPVIASCSCSIQSHCWLSPRAFKKVTANEDTKMGLFVLVVDSANYKQSDIQVKLYSKKYQDILTIDSVKLNESTLEVYVKCLDQGASGELPFELTLTTKDWTETVKGLSLVVSASVSSVSISGAAEIVFGATETYTAKVLNSKGEEMSDQEVDWHIDSSAGGKVEISSYDGHHIGLTGSNPGNVTLYATSKILPDIKSNEIVINVKYSTPTDLTLDKYELTCRADQTDLITATVAPATAKQKVNWAITTGSQYITIETTDNTCTVKPTQTALGQAVITASTIDEAGNEVISKTCTVNITEPLATGVTVTSDTTTIWNTDDETGSQYNTVQYSATVNPPLAKPGVKWSAKEIDTQGKEGASVAIDTSGKLSLSADTKEKIVRVTATSDDDRTTTPAKGTKDLTVRYVVSNFTVTGQSSVRCWKDTGTGETEKFKINTVSPKNAEYDTTAANIEWTTSDSDIAEFNEDGTLHGKQPGTVEVRATIWTHGNKGDTGAWQVLSQPFTVTVLAPYADTVTIQGSTDRSMWADGSTNFTAKVTSTTPEEETGATPSQDVNWKIYDDEACSIESTTAKITKGTGTDYSGTVTIIDPSYTAFTATKIYYVKAFAVDVESGSKESTAAKLTVKAPLHSFKIQKDNVDARVAEASQPTFSVKTDSYIPSGATLDTPIDPVFSVENGTGQASISPTTGVLNPTLAGTVKVYATLKTHDGTEVKSDAYEVTVLPPYTTQLTIVYEEETLWTDEETTSSKLQLSATYQPEAAVPGIEWSSSDEEIATVDQTGKLTLKNVNPTGGTVTITAKTTDGSGIQATQAFNVKVPAETVTIEYAPETMKVKDATTGTDTCTATVDPDVATRYGSVVWSVDNETFATIDSNTGVITANAAGTVYVTATWKASGRDDVPSDPVEVVITQPDVTSLLINGPTTLSLSDGTTFTTQQYTVTANPTGASEQVTWSVVNGTGEATISTTGILTCAAAGTVTITAKSVPFPSISNSLTVEITAVWTDIFEISEDGTTVNGFVDGLATGTLDTYVGASDELYFPTQTDTQKITKIEAGAFKNVLGGSGTTYTGHVKKITIPANITEIGDNAFDSCTDITGLEVYGTTSIGASSFVGCSSLATINALNVSSVGESAFASDNALTTINFGTNASLEIGAKAFAGITKTTGTYATLTANPKTIGKEAFMGSAVVWPGINTCAALETIEEDAFNGCQLLESGTALTINTQLANATIGLTAFYACGITSLVLPVQSTDTMYAGWTTDSLFGGCTALKSIDVSAWVSGVPSNLSEEASNMFVDAGGTTTGNKWYYKSGIDQTVIDALSAWLSAQIGEQTFAKYWSSGTK